MRISHVGITVQKMKELVGYENSPAPHGFPYSLNTCRVLFTTQIKTIINDVTVSKEPSNPERLLVFTQKK